MVSWVPIADKGGTSKGECEQLATIHMCRKSGDENGEEQSA